ncbi:MAG: hypothetical protein ABIJ56_03245 [Pseudomonadota bacterium]
MKKLATAAFFCAVCGCAGATYPREIAQAQALTESKLALSARKLAPALWKLGSDALAASLERAGKGDSTESGLLATEAMIHFKTAIAVSRGKVADERIRSLKEDMARYENDREKFTTLRKDAEVRFLKIMSYHMEQKDEAELRRSSFENEREKYLKLTDEEKEKWNNLHRPALGRQLQSAAGLVEVARFMAFHFGELQAQQDEAEKALATASDALPGPWDTARPLVDDALLKAQRLLMHQRILAKPGPIENPAARTDIFEMVGKNLGGKVFVSATFKGILLSIENPWEGKKGGLKGSAAALIDDIAGLLGGGKEALVFIETYYFDKSEKISLETSDEIGKSAMSALLDRNLDSERIAFKGWGAVASADSGPCLSSACPDGRLDIIIVNF